MPPAEDGDDRAGSPVKGIKGRKDMHVPKDVWRRHLPPPPRAPDHVEGTGRGGGPTAARVVNGVLRSLSELTMTNPKNLKRWGLGSEDEYFEHVKRRDAAKAALDAPLRDPSVSADDKHDAAASFSMNHGPAAFNCRKCWLLRGCCICRMFTVLPPRTPSARTRWPSTSTITSLAAEAARARWYQHASAATRTSRGYVKTRRRCVRCAS